MKKVEICIVLAILAMLVLVLCGCDESVEPNEPNDVFDSNIIIMDTADFDFLEADDLVFSHIELGDVVFNLEAGILTIECKSIENAFRQIYIAMIESFGGFEVNDINSVRISEEPIVDDSITWMPMNDSNAPEVMIYFDSNDVAQVEYNNCTPSDGVQLLFNQVKRLSEE